MPRIYKTKAGGEALMARYRQFLATWPVPNEQRFIETSQGKTFVIASGDRAAPPLVLLHGAGANSLSWMGDVASWAQHFRVYAVDTIGEPGLSAPSRPPLGSEAYAKWLDDVLDGLGIARARIVGISLGGWLAIDFATRRPERVEKLVLLSPGGVGKQKSGFIWKAMILMLFGAWGRRRALKLALGTDISVVPAVADYMNANFREFRPRRTRLPLFGDAQLKKLSMPVFLIVGGRDAMLDSKGTLARMQRCVTHLTVEYLPHVGHLITGQTEKILDFLRR